MKHTSTMMPTPATNKRTGVRFAGPEDNSKRSAWNSSNKSLAPPPPAERKSTLGSECLDMARANAALVAALDAVESTHSSSSSDGDNDDKPMPMCNPLVSSNVRKTISILKKGKRSMDPNPIKPLTSIRQAWTNSETRNSFKSKSGPRMVQRQPTLEESDLKDSCELVKAMAESESSLFSSNEFRVTPSTEIRESSTKRNSFLMNRENSLRGTSIKEFSESETEVSELLTTDDSSDSRW